MPGDIFFANRFLGLILWLMVPSSILWIGNCQARTNRMAQNDPHRLEDVFKGSGSLLIRFC